MRRWVCQLTVVMLVTYIDCYINFLKIFTILQYIIHKLTTCMRPLLSAGFGKQIMSDLSNLL